MTCKYCGKEGLAFILRKTDGDRKVDIHGCVCCGKVVFSEVTKR